MKIRKSFSVSLAAVSTLGLLTLRPVTDTAARWMPAALLFSSLSTLFKNAHDLRNPVATPRQRRRRLVVKTRK